MHCATCCASVPVRVLALVFLFTTAAVYEAFSLSALGGLEVWSHLRTGIWILQNHAVPQNGLFSQYPDFPWMAHSWGFDVLLAAIYKLMGLRALPVLLMVFRVALALVFLPPGAWFAAEFLARRLAGGLRSIRGPRPATATGTLLSPVVRHRIGPPVPCAEDGQRAPAALVAAAVRHLGKCGHPICVRLVGTGSALGGTRRGGDLPPSRSALVRRNRRQLYRLEWRQC